MTHLFVCLFFFRFYVVVVVVFSFAILAVVIGKEHTSNINDSILPCYHG